MPYYTVSAAEWPTNWDYKTGKSCNRAVNYSKAEEVRQAVLGVGGGHIGNYSHCSFNQKGEGTFHAEAGSHPYVGVIGTLHREEEIKTEITVPEYLLSKSIETLLKVHPYEEPVWNIVNLDNTNPVTGFGIIGELAEPADSLTFFGRNSSGSRYIYHRRLQIPRFLPGRKSVDPDRHRAL